MAAFTIPNTIETSSEIVSAEHEQNYQAIQTDLNTEVIRRDGSVAMTGQLGLVGAPTTALSAATKAYVDALMPISFAYPCFEATAPAGFVFPIGQTIARASAPLLAVAIAPDVTSPYWVDATNFKLPDMRDRTVVGKGTYKTVLDAKFGSKDAVAVAHTHTTADHTHDSVDHAHYITTGGQSASHTHGANDNGFVYWSGSYGSGNSAETPHGAGWALSWQTQTGGASNDHSHSGWTGGANNGNTSYGANSGAGNTTNSQSPTSTATDTNYQPSIVCNWAMRLA